MTSVGSYAFDLLASRPSRHYSGPAHDEPADADMAESFKGLKVLVLGAGGVGCEVLHNLATAGISSIHVIDMDTVDLTNLNRQFLFRSSDIGQFKASAAAHFIMKRFPHVTVTYSNDRVEKNPPAFFSEFNFVLLAVDTIRARKWVNAMLASLVMWRPVLVTAADAAAGTAGPAPLAYPHYRYEEDESQAAIPLIDVGSEGYMCTAKTILHGKSQCMECENNFVESKTVQVCTIESIPRRPEHCVTFIKLKLWDQLKPFGTRVNDKGVETTVPIDGDDEAHIAWIAQRAQERLEQFKLPGTIDFTFTQGVVKNSVAAVGFTNAIVAAVMVGEMFKILTHWGKPAKHYGLYSGAGRLNCNRTDLAWNPKCKVCVPVRHIDLRLDATLPDVFAALAAHPAFVATAKRRGLNYSCDVTFKKYMEERPLFTLRGHTRSQHQENGDALDAMPREDSVQSMARADSVASVTEGDRFFDLLPEHSAALLRAAEGDEASANKGCVRLRTKESRLRDVFGLQSFEDTQVAATYIIAFDDLKFLINWRE